MLGHHVHNERREAAAAGEDETVHKRRKEIERNQLSYHEQKVKNRGV